MNCSERMLCVNYEWKAKIKRNSTYWVDLKSKIIGVAICSLQCHPRYAHLACANCYPTVISARVNEAWMQRKTVKNKIRIANSLNGCVRFLLKSSQVSAGNS